MRSSLARIFGTSVLSTLALMALSEGRAAAAPPAIASRASLENRGRAFVEMTSKLVAGSTLTPAGVDQFGDGDAIVRYAQMHRGLLVVGRGASVRMGAKTAAPATVLDLEQSLPSRLAPALSTRDAASVATAKLGWLVSASEAHLVLWPMRGETARLAYAVIPSSVMVQGLPSRPRVIVDAHTGEVLEARETLTYVKAKMYPTNPTKSPTLVSVDLSLKPTGATLANPFLEAHNCVDRKRVATINVGIPATVHVCDLEHSAQPNQAGNYELEPTDAPSNPASQEDAFSELSMYAHASKAYAFFRELQGDETAQVTVDKPLQLVANLRLPSGLLQGNLSKASDPNAPLEPLQNAFFAPGGGGMGGPFQALFGVEGGALWFGQGPKRDYAYDGDVVYHEFSHAVVGATLNLGGWHLDARGAVAAPGAMNEALADYFSSALTGDPDVGEYASQDISGAGVIRTLANQDACPGSLTGEVHIDSTPFSGGLWKARVSLSPSKRRAFDAAIYKAMRTNPGSSDVGFDDLTRLFLATLKTDLPEGASALEAAMTERGILPGCERILDLDEEGVVRSPVPQLGFVAPGTQAVRVRKLAPGIMQARVPRSSDATSFKVAFEVKPSRGLGMFGNGTPFEPHVLVKFGAPISWDPASKNGHDADLDLPVKDAGESAELTVEIPEGVTGDAVYVQIASSGESDGAYDALAIDMPKSKPAAPPADSVPSSAPPSASLTADASESGCTTSRAPASPRVSPIAALALAGLAWGRRRRRSAEGARS
jgi:MYXO-CTERM domain-containing protein